MALPASSTPLFDVLRTIQSNAQTIKGQAQDAIVALQSNTNTNFIFLMLDRLGSLIVTLNGWKATPGLGSYAISALPGYAGDIVSDITAVTAAAQACIDWIVANFPKDSTATYVLAEVLNADGTRTQRVFTSVQTAGLRTQLQALVAAIG